MGIQDIICLAVRIPVAFPPRVVELNLGAVMLAESALALLHPEQLSPFARKGGVLTPSVALGDVLVERLNREGTIRIESKLVRA